MRVGPSSRFWVICLLAGICLVLSANRSDGQRFEYVITFDDVAVRGIKGPTDTPAVAHREPPTVAQSESPGEAQRDEPGVIQREPRGFAQSESSSATRREVFGEEKPATPVGPLANQAKGSGRPDRPSPKATWQSSESRLSFAPGQGIANPSFVQEGFLVEAFWAGKVGTAEGFFKRAHFHPPDLSSGFEAQHLGNRNELHGIFIRSVDGKRFGLKSLRYRVTRNRELPNKPLSLEGFSNYDVYVLVARAFDPRGPIRAQFVSFPVGLPVGNDTSLPWWKLQFSGFDLVSQVYIASSASVDFDDIVLTRSEPPPAPPERQEKEEK